MEEIICYDDCVKFGWKIYKLEDVCDILDNLRKPINSKDRQKRIEGKKESELYPYYGATGQVGFIDDYLTDGEFVLIGEDGAPYFDFSKNISYLIRGKTWVNNHAHVLKSYFNKNYLMHYLNQFNFNGYVSGTTRLKLTQGAMRKIPIEVAPLPEQRAIVSKIEQLFSELDNGISNLKLAQEQLKVYRQAVLKKAFEGELTKKWREQQTDLPDAKDLLEQIRKEREEARSVSSKKLNKTKPFTEVELAEFPRLPEEWGWERLEGIGYWTGGGTPSKRNLSYWNNGDVLWVSPKDMKTTLIVDTEDKITKDSIENSSAKWIAKDSILFVVRSGIIRRILPIALAGKNLTTNQDLQSLTLFWGDKNYVFWYCQANEQIIRDKCAKDGTTVDNIEVPRLKSYPIAICSLPEQQAIVQEIETRLSVCDKIEQDIKENLEKAEALRQSILRKAFEGKLLNERELADVRGAEDWEPAEVLLERIKAEKEGNGKKGKQPTEKLKNVILDDKEFTQQYTLQAFEQTNAQATAQVTEQVDK